MAIADRPALAVGFVGGMIAANGKSGFLGALVAGFVAGYLIIGLRKLCDKLPDALEKIAPVLIYPVLGILIIFSTVFLKQHSITDVIAALAMACMIYPFVYATQEKKETKLSQQLI